MKFIEVNNADSHNIEIINLSNVTSISKVRGSLVGEDSYYGIINFVYGGGIIRISGEDFDKLQEILQ